MTALSVFREVNGAYERVGRIGSSAEGFTFAYDSDYLVHPSARAISRALPLQDDAFTEVQTAVFFDGLLPEGRFRQTLNAVTHSEGRFANLLAKLNNESTGALVFLAEGEELPQETYVPLSFAELQAFAAEPHAQALVQSMASRLSLAGAQMKLGLYHEGTDWASGWFRPEGSAPSNCIVKAVDGTFPGQTVNEALCLLTARNLGFEAAEATLINAEAREPLLAVKRFDRAPGAGMRPMRRHQEDFCQALGLPSFAKYEPTDGHYLSAIANCILHESSNPFGDRAVLFRSIILDWLLGNCDNHLKNRSLLYSSDWSTCELSPLYDLTCTTIYSWVDREMGVSLCPSRRIDKVTADDLEACAKVVGVPMKLACGLRAELADGILAALEKAERDIVEQGFPQVAEVANHIEADVRKRLSLLRG